MTFPDDNASQRDKSHPTPVVGYTRETSAGDGGSPTFAPEAASLLNHLKIGVCRSAGKTASERPHIPGFEIECELGSGGMGVVYKARQLGLNRTVALKMIQAADRATPGEVVRFLAEAEAVASVKHPNVVQVYDLGDIDGRPYFVMEYVEGGNLAALLKAKIRLDSLTAAKLLEPVARGVQAAHDAGIVHRDLKPANILLTEDRGQRTEDSEGTTPRSSLSSVLCPLSSHSPKVSDFGLAKRLSSDLTRTQAVMGTPAYMAPEQAGGKAKFVGPAADVYALGVILYECLTGKVPFDSEDPWSVIRQVLDEPPEGVRKRVPGVPRDLELICLKCLEKEPHHRYPSAAALADDLKRFLNGEPVSVRPIRTTTRVARWAKRHPASAALITLVAMLLVAVPPLVLWNQGRLDRRKADTLAAEQERVKADYARIAAEQLAAAQELFGIQNTLRTRATDRDVGWTRANRAALPRAVALALGDENALTELRTAAAISLLSPDLRELDPMLKGFTASAAATDPKSGLVALGEFKSWDVLNGCRVRLVDPATGRIVRELTFTPDILKGSDGGLVQDGSRSLAFSPDGARLFLGTRGSKVVRFDLDNPRNTPAASWKASTYPVEQLGVSRDGKTVYALCKPEVPVLAFDADTGKPRPKLEPKDPARIRSFAVLPSGDVIGCNGHHLHRWTPEGKLVESVENRGANRLVATPHRMLLVGDGALLDLYDRDTYERTDRFTDPDLRHASHDEELRSIAVHPSGAFVATSSGDNDRTVKVWGLASGRLLGTVISPGTDPIALAWSGDGKFLVSTATGRTARWEFLPSESQRFAGVNGQTLASAAFLPDDKLVALSDAIGNQRAMLVGASRGGVPTATPFDETGGNGRPGVAVSPSGAIAVTRNRLGLVRWKPGEPVPQPWSADKLAWCPRFSPDGAKLWAIVDSSSVRAFNPLTGASVGEWSNAGAITISGLGSLDSLAVGRSLVAVGGRNGAVVLLDSATCKFVDAFSASGDPVVSVAIAPDESLVVAGTQHGKLRMVRPAAKVEHPAVAAHHGGVTAVTISRDGSLLATGGRDRVVRLWKRTGDRFEPLFAVSDLPVPVRELQFSPTDGRLLVLLAHEHAVRVWDMNRLKEELGELKLGW